MDQQPSCYSIEIQQEISPISGDIASSFFYGLVPEENPILVAIGGGPASGKTTWRRKMQPAFKNYFLHDMDEVMIRLPEYRQDLAVLGSLAAFEKWWKYAMDLSEEGVRFAIASKFSILYDRTCGASGSYQDLLEAKKQGYFIRLVGLTVDRSAASFRAQKRKQEEGRAITEEIIDEYRARFSAFWPLYLAFVDEAFLYDTTEDPPEMIYSSKEGILNLERYQKFLEEGVKR